MVQMRDAETLGGLSQAIFLAAGATAENAEGVTRPDSRSGFVKLPWWSRSMARTRLPR